MSNKVTAASDHQLQVSAAAEVVSPSLQGKYKAMIVCWILGNGCLFPWNSVLTIEDYYSILFPKYHPARVLTLVYQPCGFITITILAFHEAKLNTRVRNIVGYIFFFLASVLVLLLDIGANGKGGIGPFVGICIAGAIFGISEAQVAGGMVGDLSLMPPQLLQSYLAGAAASGALTSLIRIITKAAFQNSHNGLRKGALTFFAIACINELACVILYVLVFPKLPIVRHYRSKVAVEGSKTVSSDLAAGGVQHNQLEGELEGGTKGEETERLSSKQLLAQNKDYAFDMLMLCTLTLSIFPGFLYEDTGSHSLGEWYALVLIAMFNVCDFIGRYTPLVPLLQIKSRKVMLVATLSRLLFIPAFYFTAKYGSQGYMIFLTSVLGFTNGHLIVCIFTAAPIGYKPPEQNALGNVLVLFFLGGIFLGVVLDWLWLIGKGW